MLNHDIFKVLTEKDCQSRKLPEKAAATKPETSKTTAETSGIAMKAQPTE